MSDPVQHELDQKFKRFETYQGHRVVEDSYFVIRLDGRNFSKLTEKEFSKPFDDNFKKIMTHISSKLFEEFSCIYAFTISDEISLLFKYDYKIFERKIEKLLSLTAAAASSEASLISGKRMQFDSRIVTLPNETCCIDYFLWRQNGGFHNALNDYAYWSLIGKGWNKNTAHSEINNKNYANKITLLFSYGLNFFEIPSCYRRGVGFCWEQYSKEAVNPKNGENIIVNRRRIVQKESLPAFEEYKDFLKLIIKNNDDTSTIDSEYV